MKWRETSNRTLAQLNQHTTIHSSSLFENGRADECWLLKSNAPQGNSPAFLCELVNKGRAAVPAELPQLWDWFAFSLLLCGWVMGWWASQWLRPKKQTKRKRQIILNNEGRRQPKEAPWIQQMKAINAKKLNLFNWMELMRQWRWMNKRSTKPPTVARQVQQLFSSFVGPLRAVKMKKRLLLVALLPHEFIKSNKLSLLHSLLSEIKIKKIF